MILSSLFDMTARRQLKELYSFSVLFALAQSLLLIFEPVFLYQQGFSLATIALYYALHYSLYVVLLPLGGKCVARFGAERSLAFSTPLFVAYFLTLALLPGAPVLFWVALVLLTLHKIFYWPAYHVDFALSSDGGNRGTEISWMNVVVYGVGVLGPLLGGLIIAGFGFPVLFIAAAGLVLLSSIPLLRTNDEHHAGQWSYGAPWKILFKPEHRGMVLTMAGMGENLVEMVVWPIFMFIVLGSPAWLGAVAALSAVFMTLWGFVVGEWTDRRSDRTVRRLHVPFMALANLLAPLAVTPLRVVLNNVMLMLTFSGVHIPMLARLYATSNRAGVVKYCTAFEMMLALTKAVFAFVLVVIFTLWLPQTAFTIVFILSALSAFLYAVL